MRHLMMNFALAAAFIGCSLFASASSLAQEQPAPTTRSADDVAIHDLLHKWHNAVVNDDSKSFDSCLVQVDGMDAFRQAAFGLNRAGQQFADAVVKAYGEKSLDGFKHVEWKEGEITISGGLTIPPRDDQAIDQIDVEIQGDRAQLPHGEMMVTLVKKDGQWLVDPSAGLRPGSKPDDSAPLLNDMAKIMRDGAAEAATGKISANDLALEMAQKIQHLIFG
jgi:hypothetical protein